MKKKTVVRRHNPYGYRSGLEQTTATDLHLRSVAFAYEQIIIEYLIPAKFHTYKPDFLLLNNGIIVETKGLFETADRQKHLFIKEQIPDLDIRFVFQNPYNKISKGSKTTYAAWADKNGFLWAWKQIPESWTKEPPKTYLPTLLTHMKEGIKIEKSSFNSGR